MQAVENGQRALELLQAENRLPSVILLDLMMPVMSGREFRRRQQADPRLAGIPVVLRSADRNLDNHRVELAEAEALPKPLDIDALIRVLSRLTTRTSA